MKSKTNLSTRGVAFGIQILTAIFIFALLALVIGHLPTLAAPRIEDAQSHLEVLETEKKEAQAAGLTEKDDEMKSINGKIDFYRGRIDMLENRSKYYAGAMIVLVLVSLTGAVVQSIKSASFQKESDGFLGQKPKQNDYYPLFSAPLSAVCMLLAIGVTYQSLFEWGLKELGMLIIAIVVGVITYVVYRRGSDFSAGLNLRYVGTKMTWADLLFLAPAAGILVLLAALLIFGVSVNGAKLWISIGGITLQPGEFIKVLLMVLFASSYGKMWRAMTALGMSAFTMLAMLLLRDMGTAMVIFAMAVAMLLLLLDNKITFSLYEHKRLLVLLLVLALPAFVFVLACFPYATHRFTNIGQAMQGVEETQQGMMIKALIFGGFKGLGPENFPYVYRIFSAESDMAIAGITAVFGYGMLLILLLCYAVLVVIPLRKHAVQREFYFISVQFSVVLTLQVLLNALGSVDVLPFTGIVAPFISDGGSALISFCAMMGLVLATLHPVIKPLEVKRS